MESGETVDRAGARTVRVWDLPTRVFHWTLALAVIGLVITAKVGGNAMEVHKKLGFLVLGLIVFRVIWGFVGSRHARFSSFVRGPATALAYFKSMKNGNARRYLGHNPLGAWSVVALLTVVGFQATSGLFADDDILMKGPYADAVSSATSALLTKLHKWNANAIYALVGLHLAAVLFYVFVKRDNLIKAMFSGSKPVSAADDVPAEPQASMMEMAEAPRPAWVFWLVAVVVALTTIFVVTRKFG